MAAGLDNEIAKVKNETHAGSAAAPAPEKGKTAGGSTISPPFVGGDCTKYRAMHEDEQRSNTALGAWCVGQSINANTTTSPAPEPAPNKPRGIWDTFGGPLLKRLTEMMK